MSKQKKGKSAPKPPSEALMNMMPPKLRSDFEDLKAARDDENVSEEAWERQAMNLMHATNSMPPVIRDAVGRAVKKIAAIERYETKKAEDALKAEDAADNPKAKTRKPTSAAK